MIKLSRLTIATMPWLVLCGPLTGCATNAFQSALDQTSAQGINVVTRNPELDAVIISGKNATAKSCHVPESDGIPIDNFGLSGSVSIPIAGQTDTSSVAVNSGAGTVTLGGVTPSVLISREIMFRTCEFIVNENLSQADAVELFKLSLQEVSTISAGSSATGSAPQTAAEQAPIQQ